MNFLSKAKEILTPKIIVNEEITQIVVKLKKNKQSLQSLKRKKQWLQYQEKVFFETDSKRRETITRKIELINIVIAEFQPQMNPNSLNNLKHRRKF